MGYEIMKYACRGAGYTLKNDISTLCAKDILCYVQSKGFAIKRFRVLSDLSGVHLCVVKTFSQIFFGTNLV